MTHELRGVKVYGAFGRTGLTVQLWAPADVSVWEWWR